MPSNIYSQRRSGGAAAAATLSALVVVSGLSAVSALVLPGCGSSGGTMPVGSGGLTRHVGSVTLSVVWPPYEPGRLIPKAAQSIQVSAADADGNIITQQVIARPTSGNTTQTTLANVPSGPVTVTAIAFPEANAGGVPQARGSVDVTVVADQTVPVTLTMNTTIDRIDVTPIPVMISRNGGRLSLVATPYDDQNRVVLTAPSNWKWTLASSGLITVASDGEKAVVTSTGTGSGTVSLTAREDEAGKEQAVTVTVLDGTPLAAGEWPKARGNARNTGQISGVQGPVANPETKWVYTATGGQYPITPPIIGTDGTIYVGLNGGNLVALDPDDGTVRWSVAAAITSGGGSGSPSANIAPPPAITADDILYVPGGDGVLRALRASNGSVKWQTTAGALGVVTAGPAIGTSGTIYVVTRGTDGELLRALNPLDGSVRWNSPVLSDNPGTTGSPALSADGSVIYLATASNYLAGFNAASGGLRWALPLSARAVGSVVVAAAPSVGANGSILLGATDGYIRSVASNGNSNWAFATGTVNANTASGLAPSTALSPDGSAVYAGGEDNTFYALNTSNGSQRWGYSTGSTTSPVSFSSPAVDGSGEVYFTVATRTIPSTAQVVSLSPSNGAVLWSFSVDTLGTAIRPFDPALGHDGTVYVSSGTKVYAIRQKP